MEAGTIFSMWLLHTNLVRRHPRAPDTEVGRSVQCYDKRTLYVDTRPRASGYVFKPSLRLHSEEASHKEDEGGEVSALSEPRLQVTIIRLFLHCM